MKASNIVQQSDTIATALEKMNHTGGDLLVVVDPNGRFIRAVSQGDIRRHLLAGYDLSSKLENLGKADSIFALPDMSFSTIEALFASSLVDKIPLLDEHGVPKEMLDSKNYERILLSTPHMGGDEQKYVAQAFDSNWLAPAGPNLDSFEHELGEYLDAENVLAVTSGTAAIHLALIVLGIKAGDTVLCSSFTFAASANPICYQGATPVFVDSDEASWNLSPTALLRAIEGCFKKGQPPKALVLVQLYGQLADVDEIKSICKHYGIKIIEDAAESIGAKYNGQASGTLTDIGILSFNGNKIITTSGGGALVSNNKEWIDHARFLSTQAKELELHYEHKQIGYNYRMSNVLAGIGRGQLQVLDDRVKRRRLIFETYRKRLQEFDVLTWMPEVEGCYSTRWLTTMTIDPDFGKSPIDLIKHLSDNGIEARPMWKPMHLQPVFSKCDYYPYSENRSVCDELFANGICLPSGSNVTEDGIERIGDLIAEFLR
jgi:dTDP-4-amino-4,6-dideoxygalactose transaminase